MSDIFFNVLCVCVCSRVSVFVSDAIFDEMSLIFDSAHFSTVQIFDDKTVHNFSLSIFCMASQIIPYYIFILYAGYVGDV